MEKKIYMQPETKTLKCNYMNDIADDLIVSGIGGKGPVDIGEGDQDEGVDPTSNTSKIYDPWDSDSWNVWK